jgi:non-specific riboncleoside hydrolase
MDLRHHGGGYRGKLGQPANARVALGLDVEGFQRWAAEVIALAP